MANIKKLLATALSGLMDDVVKLEEMFNLGFGDKKCLRQLRQFSNKVRALQDVLVGTEDKEDFQEEQTAVTSSPEIVMVLGSDGEQHRATSEDLRELGELGAPVGSQDRKSFMDDFGNDENEVV